MIGATHSAAKRKGSEASAVTRARGNDQGFAAMSLIEQIDYGTPASKSEKSVTLTIDGKGVGVPEGTSILRAPMHLGMDIPNPGYRHASSDEARTLFEDACGVVLDPGPGLRLPNMFDAARPIFLGGGRR